MTYGFLTTTNPVDETTDPTIGQTIDDAASVTGEIWQTLTNPDTWARLAGVALRIVIIIVLTQVAIRISYKLIDRALLRQHKEGKENKFRVKPRRFVTVGKLLKNVAVIVFNFMMIMLIISELGYDLAPLIAGAGVVGLAIGFGAQSLVKDVITGFFIVFEDQFAVGDVVQITTYKGTVEMIGLRTTRLRNWNGEVYAIPNGTITSVTNFSLANAKAVIDIPMSAERQLDESLHLVARALEKVCDQHEVVLNTPEIRGIQAMTAGEYTLRVTVNCSPNAQSEVESLVRGEIKRAMERSDDVKKALAEESERKAKKEETKRLETAEGSQGDSEADPAAGKAEAKPQAAGPEKPSIEKTDAEKTPNTEDKPHSAQ
ncbi:mechanosensitive ion channel [Saccharibacillus sp. CPCC 101409]|uniref:mechanosensitive ion channel family protein n=1 Tax=Saccharibacillus sp. CPCC 101409 TaxID=3058041 RepID=UPI002671FDBE|nr:mechanosensitive ion channel domain-containing protein [Saccharibacillus sp. CPCC 101409]MDO3413234.1 mechanosensitive ion channel [Saccharibacillus sp. CPCC 101409]